MSFIFRKLLNFWNLKNSSSSDNWNLSSYCVYLTMLFKVHVFCNKKQKAKTIAKLNSTEMDLWRRSAWISRKDRIRNNIIKQKLNVTRYLLEDIKTKQLQCVDMSKEWRRGDYEKKYWNGGHQGEENEVDLNLPGRRGLEEWWEKRG